MTDLFKEPARSTASNRTCGEDNARLVHVLLLDLEYMAAHEKKHPGYYVTRRVDLLDDSRRINEEIREAVLGHPCIEPGNVRFFTDPYTFISNLAAHRLDVKCVLNFCDDFTDRVGLWSMPILFDMLDLPACGYGASGMLAHNKFHAYSVARQFNIAVPESRLVTSENAAIVHFDEVPLLVKPNDAGGSEGITFRNLARCEGQLRAIIDELLGQFSELLVSEYLPGDELIVSLMRRGRDIIPLPIKQVSFRNFSEDPAIITSDFKWDKTTLGDRDLVAKIFDGDPSIKDRVIRDSIKLFKVLGCKDFARVDWKCDADGEPRFIDFNESPMISASSSFTWCLERGGFTRHDLFVAMIDNVLAAMDGTSTQGKKPGI